MANEKPGAGDSGLAEALLAELGDLEPGEALVFDEQGNPVSDLAKRRVSSAE